MKRWLIGVVVALGLGAVAVEVIDEAGLRGDGDAPQRVKDAASRSLSCPGASARRIRCEPTPEDRWRCRAITARRGLSSEETEIEVDDDHPEVSVIC